MVSCEKAAALRDAAARSSALVMATLIFSPFSIPSAACTELLEGVFGCLSYRQVPETGGGTDLLHWRCTGA